MPPERPPLKPLERSLFGGLSHLMVNGWNRMQRAWFRWADLNQHAPWFPYFVAGVVLVDAIVVVLPGDVLVALSVLSNAGRWKRLALYSGIGGAIGATILLVSLSHWGQAPLDRLGRLGAPSSVEELAALNEGQPDLESGLAAMGSEPSRPAWQRAKAVFKQYGLPSLAITSVLPLLSWPTVIVAGLSTDRWLEAFFWLLIGRLARYWILCFGVREGWAMFQALREEAEEQRRLRLAEQAAGAKAKGRRRKA